MSIKSAAILEYLICVAGLAVAFGVFLESERFSKLLQKAGYIVVILGIIAENTLGFALFKVESDQLTAQEFKTETALNEAAVALRDVVASKRELRDSVEENAALERALQPRIIDFNAIDSALRSLPTKVPIFIASVGQDEPNQLASAIERAAVGNRKDHPLGWIVHRISTPVSAFEGVYFRYVGLRDTSFPESEAAAIALCEAVRSQEIDATVVPVPRENYVWPDEIPANAIFIAVGRRPTAFWYSKLSVKYGSSTMVASSGCTSDEKFDAMSHVTWPKNSDPRKPP